MRPTPKEALDQLPGPLEVTRGGCRITARFLDGKVQGRPRVTIFRVPGNATPTIALNPRGPIRIDLLELIAQELQLDQGETELVVEYAASHREGAAPGLVLHYVDFSWDEPLAPHA
jgi:hypothetical protein